MKEGTLTPSRCRILVVGDLALKRSLITTLLVRLGYDVQSVRSGEEALAVHRRFRPHVVMFSLCLPDMHPTQLVRAIISDERAKKSGFVAFGDGFGLERERRPLGELGVEHLLSKSLPITELLRAIREICDAYPATAMPQGNPVNEPLDLTHFESFTNGDEQLERELVSLFMSTASMYVETLRDALADPERWRSTAHALKGSSGNIGAHPLSEVAKRAEQAPPSAALLEEIEQKLAELASFFSDRIAQPAPSPERR